MASDGAGAPPTDDEAGTGPGSDAPKKKAELTIGGLGKAVFKALSSIEPVPEGGYLAKTAEDQAKRTLKKVASLSEVSTRDGAKAGSSVQHPWTCQDCGQRGEGGTKDPDRCSDTSGKWSFYWGCCNCALDKHGWSKYESHGCPQCKDRRAAGNSGKVATASIGTRLTSVLELRAAAAQNVGKYAASSVLGAQTARALEESLHSTRAQTNENTEALIDYSKRVWKISNWWCSPPQALERSSSKPKLLIVYSDTGGGHKASANAICAAFEHIVPGQIEVIYTYTFTYTYMYIHTYAYAYIHMHMHMHMHMHIHMHIHMHMHMHLHM